MTRSSLLICLASPFSPFFTIPSFPIVDVVGRDQRLKASLRPWYGLAVEVIRTSATTREYERSAYLITSL